MKKEEIQNVAFQLISSVGEAYDFFYRALDAAKEGDFERSDQLILDGEKKITDAHSAQTTFLAAEARGEDMEYSIIMIHAQDSLMTTILFERVIKELIQLYKKVGND